MANKLTNAQIAALLSRTVSTLKPGDLEDLRAALDARHVTSGGGAGSSPDKARANETVLNSLLPTTTTTTTTTTTSTTTTTHTTTTTTTVSDRRLKENVRLLATLLDLGIYSYNFIGSSQRVVGLMAQEVYQKYPEAIIVGGDDPRVRPWKIDYNKLFRAIGNQKAHELRAFLAIRAAA